MPRFVHLPAETSRQGGSMNSQAVCKRRVSIMFLTSNKERATCPKCLGQEQPKRTRRAPLRTEAKALEAALLQVTGKRWQVRYHRGTARGWFDILPMKRDMRTIRYGAGEGQYLRGAELEQVRRHPGRELGPSARQIAALKNVLGDSFHYNSCMPGSEAWYTWVALGRKGPEPWFPSRDWD